MQDSNISLQDSIAPMTICSSLYTKYTSAEQTIIEYFSMTITSYMTNRVSTETLKYSSNDYYVCNIQILIYKIQFVEKQFFIPI